MKPIEIPALDAEQEQLAAALDDLYRSIRNARLWTRARPEMVLLWPPSGA